MKRLTTLDFLLLGLAALLVTGPLAQAAKPTAPVNAPAPVSGEVSQQSGKIEYLDLGKNLIVINDREYGLSNNLTVNGKSGARYSLRKGMRISFTDMPGKGRPIINEIRSSQ